jgi:hypothetical protein
LNSSNERGEFKHYGKNIFPGKTSNMQIRNKKNALQTLKDRDILLSITMIEFLYLGAPEENRQVCLPET